MRWADHAASWRPCVPASIDRTLLLCGGCTFASFFVAFLHKCVLHGLRCGDNASSKNVLQKHNAASAGRHGWNFYFFPERFDNGRRLSRRLEGASSSSLVASPGHESNS
eukprot:GHVU01143208.1.p2 GENE.GHVU01143208.1~~GHVU01143208.1.p2  ORF type:complete len:109 (-),score=3.67 GHVU01143208.1:67-393(-)